MRCNFVAEFLSRDVHCLQKNGHKIRFKKYSICKKVETFHIGRKGSISVSSLSESRLFLCSIVILLYFNEALLLKQKWARLLGSHV